MSWRKEGCEHRARATASPRQHEAEWLLSSSKSDQEGAHALGGVPGELYKDTEHTEDTHLAAALGEMGPKGWRQALELAHL